MCLLIKNVINKKDKAVRSQVKIYGFAKFFVCMSIKLDIFIAIVNSRPVAFGCHKSYMIA